MDKCALHISRWFSNKILTFVINKWRFQPVGGTRGDSGFGVGNKAHSSKRCDFSSVPDRIRCDEQKCGEIVTNPKKRWSSVSVWGTSSNFSFCDHSQPTSAFWQCQKLSSKFLQYNCCYKPCLQTNPSKHGMKWNRIIWLPQHQQHTYCIQYKQILWILYVLFHFYKILKKIYTGQMLWPKLEFGYLLKTWEWCWWGWQNLTPLRFFIVQSDKHWTMIVFRCSSHCDVKWTLRLQLLPRIKGHDRGRR